MGLKSTVAPIFITLIAITFYEHSTSLEVTKVQYNGHLQMVQNIQNVNECTKIEWYLENRKRERHLLTYLDSNTKEMKLNDKNAYSRFVMDYSHESLDLCYVSKALNMHHIVLTYRCPPENITVEIYSIPIYVIEFEKTPKKKVRKYSKYSKEAQTAHRLVPFNKITHRYNDKIVFAKPAFAFEAEKYLIFNYNDPHFVKECEPTMSGLKQFKNILTLQHKEDEIILEKSSHPDYFLAFLIEVDGKKLVRSYPDLLFNHPIMIYEIKQTLVKIYETETKVFSYKLFVVLGQYIVCVFEKAHSNIKYDEKFVKSYVQHQKFMGVNFKKPLTGAKIYLEFFYKRGNEYVKIRGPVYSSKRKGDFDYHSSSFDLSTLSLDNELIKPNVAEESQPSSKVTLTPLLANFYSSDGTLLREEKLLDDETNLEKIDEEELEDENLPLTDADTDELRDKVFNDYRRYGRPSSSTDLLSVIEESELEDEEDTSYENEKPRGDTRHHPDNLPKPLGEFTFTPSGPTFPGKPPKTGLTPLTPTSPSGKERRLSGGETAAIILSIIIIIFLIISIMIALKRRKRRTLDITVR